MTGKKHVGILFGGRSCEHEVSVTSARSVLKAIDRSRYDVSLIAIDKHGQWHLGSDLDALVQEKQVLPASSSGSMVTMQLHHEGKLTETTPETSRVPNIDVLFPVLHGTFGEDGTIQGVFEMAGIPYVGCGVAASAIAMDKALAKQVFASAGIPQAPCQIVLSHQWREDLSGTLDLLEQRFGFPQFVKPANMGSSVGVGKASDRKGLERAIEDALTYDNKIVVEQSMENCHEVECAVLGNEDPIASVVGEIVPGADFYDYQTKYIDDKSETLIPARIPDAVSERVRQLSIDAFRAIDGSGLSRVDFFVHRNTHDIYLNEVNTLPGFTPISMYPKMFEASGIPYAELIDRLIDLAFDRHASRAGLKRAF